MESRKKLTMTFVCNRNFFLHNVSEIYDFKLVISNYFNKGSLPR